MISKNGQNYPTIADAAKEFGVSTKTVGKWIDDRVIPEPPTMEYGLRRIQYFPAEYIQKAKASLNRYRERRSNPRRRTAKQ
jgi:hypothetical protein